MVTQAAATQALVAAPQDDVLLTAAAAFLAIAIICVLVLRARFPGPLIQRVGPAPRHRATGGAPIGRCRWQARGDLNDKDLKAWSCTGCGKLRWTSSRSEPPEACR